MAAHTRAELLALTPDQYLAQGYLGPDGKPRPILLTGAVTAAATQLLQAELAPQEFGFTLAALREVLPLHKTEPPAVQAMSSLVEALTIVARMIGQRNNKGFVTWLLGCAERVREPGDVDAWLAHMHSVLQQYGLLASFADSPP